jgi:hypothetical protein
VRTLRLYARHKLALIGRVVRAWLCACAVLAAPVSANEAPKGASQELGIAFRTTGGTDWCREDILVELTARRPQALDIDAQPFVLMIGRIRAVVQNLCPDVERLRFEAPLPNAEPVRFELSRLTSWRRITPMTPGFLQPACTEPATLSTCARAAELYAIAHRAFRGKAFSEVTLLDWQDGLPTDGISWRERDVVGRIASLWSLPELPKTDAAQALGVSLSLAAVEACRRAGRTAEDRTAELEGGALTLYLVRCDRGGDMTSQAFVVVERQGRPYAFSAAVPRADEDTMVSLIAAMVK